jgi:hypothetical protein
MMDTAHSTSNSQVSSPPPSSSAAEETLNTQPTLKDVTHGLARVENVVLDLTKQVMLLNNNLTMLLSQQRHEWSSGLMQTDMQRRSQHEERLAPSPSTDSRDKRDSDAVSQLSLQVAALSTSVAQLLSTNHQRASFPMGPPMRSRIHDGSYDSVYPITPHTTVPHGRPPASSRPLSYRRDNVSNDYGHFTELKECIFSLISHRN